MATPTHSDKVDLFKVKNKLINTFCFIYVFASQLSGIRVVDSYCQHLFCISVGMSYWLASFAYLSCCQYEIRSNKNIIMQKWVTRDQWHC